LKPNEAVLAVTLGCNSRCQTCDLWKVKRGVEMKPEDYARLPSSLTHINLSGGEPYLREDLPEIYAVLRDKFPKARIIASTNGLLPERIEDMTSRMPELAVRVSLDAIGPKNDEIRGVPGAYAKSLETLRRLSALGVKDLGVSATASRGNCDQLLPIYGMARNRGMEFVCSVTHSSSIYFGRQEGLMPTEEECLPELGALVSRQLKSLRPKEWFRAYMTSGMMDYVSGLPRRFPCTAIDDYFYLDPAGVVFPCNMRDDVMGSILENSYDEIVAASPDVNRNVRNCRIQCWMSCTVAPTLRRKPWIAVPWIIKNRFGAKGTHARPAGPRTGMRSAVSGGRCASAGGK
jgi:MoaA/NifB/PqqE/SkfB family radical SAM enzyme